MMFRTLRLGLLVAGIVVTALASPVLAGSYNAAGGVIPDNQPGNPLIMNFAVTDVGPITSVDVTLNSFTHTWVGDMIATLTGPGGVATILNRTTNEVAASCTSTVGNSANVAGNYRFIDSGASIAAALNANPATLAAGDYTASTRTVPTTCTAPLSLGSIFNGTNAVGNWTLSVTDNAALDSGTIGSATLNVNTVPEPAIFGVALLGLGLLGIRRR
ncbi:MAG TPA: PEP-CTERM sorting domain-containing protein [Pirellulaceae bacterium]